MRDTIRYCGILLDDTNRKPICRLWFNIPESKLLGVFDEKKHETRHPIGDVNDIYKFAQHLKEAAARYDSGKSVRSEAQGTLHEGQEHFPREADSAPGGSGDDPH